MQTPWSYHTLIDLFGCNVELITSREAIEEYVIRLCDLIDMRRYGDPIIVHFGEEERVAGYSLVQLIETSLVAGHFVDADHTAFIDIHSCKPYSVEDAVAFTVEFFQALEHTYSVTERGVL